MDGELQKKKWFCAIKCVAVLLVACLLCITVTTAKTQPYTDMSTESWFNKDYVDNGEMAKQITVTSMLLNSDASVVSETNDSVTKTITATVLPANATCPELDWTAAWDDSSTRSAENVPDYLILSPESDGSPVLNITCIQGFIGDSIIITATTREGNYTATCTVYFTGIPSEFTIDCLSVLPTTYVVGGNGYDVQEDSEYLIPLNANNVFGSVSPEYTVEITGVGTITAYYKYAETDEWKSNMTEIYHLTERGTVRSKIIKGSEIVELGGQFYYKLTTGKFYNLEYSYTESDDESSWTTYCKFLSSTDGLNKPAYYTIKVKENKSGITRAFNLFFQVPVSSVSLAASSIEF